MNLYYWKNIPRKYKWAAKDSDESVYAYTHKPVYFDDDVTPCWGYGSDMEGYDLDAIERDESPDYINLPRTKLSRSVRAEDSLEERPDGY